MGQKSRGNWNIPWCSKIPICKNARKRCVECLRMNKFVRREKDEGSNAASVSSDISD